MTSAPQLTHLDVESSRRLRARFRLLPGDAVFRGHFPGQPVMPGVAQVHWAAELANRHMPAGGSFAGLEGLKFLRLIVPPVDIELRLEWRAPGQLLEFHYHRLDDGRCCSTGRLRFS